MMKHLSLAPILLVISVAAAQPASVAAAQPASVAAAQPARTEFVTGNGFLRSSFGISVEFSVNVSQQDPNDPAGWMTAVFYSFPQHLFMTFESTGLTSLAVDKRTALVTGTAMVSDDRSAFLGEVGFSAVFEDLNARKKRPQNDRMTLTLHFPTGAETFSGGIVPGGIEVGTRRR